MWVLLGVCAACPTPRLNLKVRASSLLEEIHGTLTTGTAQGNNITTTVILLFSITVKLYIWANRRHNLL